MQSGYYFAETIERVIAIQDQTIRTSDYKKYILKDSNATNDVCRKCLEKSETVQHVTVACRGIGLSQDD